MKAKECGVCGSKVDVYKFMSSLEKPICARCFNKLGITRTSKKKENKILLEFRCSECQEVVGKADLDSFKTIRSWRVVCNRCAKKTFDKTGVKWSNEKVLARGIINYYRKGEFPIIIWSENLFKGVKSKTIKRVRVVEE